jgi:hypothetical protein
VKIDCPRCGASVDCGDKREGTRLRCAECRYRPVLRHIAERPDCEPFCHEPAHWFFRFGRAIEMKETG